MGLWVRYGVCCVCAWVATGPGVFSLNRALAKFAGRTPAGVGALSFFGELWLFVAWLEQLWVQLCGAALGSSVHSSALGTASWKQLGWLCAAPLVLLCSAVRTVFA